MTHPALHPELMPRPARSASVSQQPGSTAEGPGPGVEVAMASFVGRTAELGFLRARLAEAESGVPRTVVLEGAGGAGKSALLHAFLGSLDSGAVLSASGEEAEAFLRFGVLTQLLALRSASWADPFAAGGRLLEVLDDRATTVVVIDDAQHADADSLTAIAFALRRLHADRVLAVFATRDAELLPTAVLKLAEDEDGRLRLPGLTVGETAELAALGGHVGLSRHDAERLRQHTAGNPLHLRALLDDLPTVVLRGPGALPAPRSLAQHLLRILRAQPDDARALARAASIVADRTPLARVAAVAALPRAAAVEAVETLSRANLLSCEYAEDGWLLGFTHPLVRAAVYDDLGPADRQRLHYRAAEVIGGESGLLHRAAAATGTEPGLADELVAAAAERQQRGDVHAAAGLWLKTQALWEEGPQREAALLEAANLYLIAGDVASARRAVERLDDLPVTAQRLYLQARVAWLGGQPTEAEDLAERAWRRGDELDRAGRGSCAAILAQLHNLRGDGGGATEWAHRALEHELPPDLVDTTRAALAAGLALTGRVAEALESLADLPSDARACGAEHEHQLITRGALRLATDDLSGSHSDLEALANRSSDLAPQRLLAMGVLAEAEFRRGRWDDALTRAEHAITLAEDSDQVWVQGFLHTQVAQVAAARGDFDTAEDQLARALELAERLEDVTTYAVTASVATHLAWCRGDPAAVVEQAEVLSFFRAAPTVEPGWLSWPVQHLSALVELGRLEEAESALEAYDETARARGSRSRLAALARVRGELATARRDHTAAREHFEEALSIGAGAVDALERAVVLASYGRFLRRRGERRSAHERLSDARAMFQTLGAVPLTARCDEELAAAGLAAGGLAAGGLALGGLAAEPQAPSVTTALTPQERLIASLACEGLSNQEIAHRLVLSVKTVGYHLSNAYTKLDVHSRAQLVARLGRA